MLAVPNTYLNKPEKVGSYKILGLAGKRKTGKSYCASLLCASDPRFKEISFASSLKKAYAELHMISETELHDLKLKEKHRRGLQIFSLEMKEEYGEFVFVNRLIQELDPNQHYVISDVRFLCELQTICLLGGSVYKVYADNHVRAQRGWYYDPRIDEDISETEVGDLSSDTFYKCSKGGFIYNTKDESYVYGQLQLILGTHFPCKISDLTL